VDSDDSGILSADEPFQGDELGMNDAYDGYGEPDEAGELDPRFDTAFADEDVAYEHDEAEDAPVIAPISDPVGTARRRHGAAGAMLAAGMFGVDIALGRKPKEEAPVVIASSSDPIDIETDGIVVPVDDVTSVFAPPQPRTDPFPPRRPRR